MTFFNQKRLIKFIPWLSMSWGIFSALSMHRGFSQSVKIATLTGVVVVATMIHSLIRGTEYLLIEAGPLKKSKASAGWVSKRALQAWSQFILMFSLPNLISADAWFAASVTAFLAMMTLWEPWFEKLMFFSSGRAALRTWSGLLSISFLSGVFFGENFGLIYRYFAIPALIMSFPWIDLAKKKTRSLSFAPFCAAAIFSMGSYLGLTHFRFPLVAIWLNQPHFFFKSDTSTKTEIETLPSPDVIKNKGICFLSPVTAARDMRTAIIHEWYVDGALIDRIKLKEIHGRDENKSFNTWSCKQNLPEITRALRVKVVLPPNAVIGERSLHY